MKIREAVVVCAASFAALVAFGATVTKSGDYNDVNIWLNKEAPTDDGTSAVDWGGNWSTARGAMIPVSVDVHLNGETKNVKSLSTSTLTRDPGDLGLYPVTLWGEGGTLNLSQTDGLVSVNAYRRMTYDNVTINYGNTGGNGLQFYGEIVFRNKTRIQVSGNTPYFYVRSLSKTVIDDASVETGVFVPDAAAELVIRNGGSLSFSSYYVPTSTVGVASAKMKTRVIDGNVTVTSKGLYTGGFLPERSGTVAAKGFFPLCPSGETTSFRLGGTARIDTALDTEIDLTNNVHFYGGGKLYVGYLNGFGASHHFDLSALYMGLGPASSGTAANSRYYGGDGLEIGFLQTGKSFEKFYPEGALTVRTDNPLTGNPQSMTLSGVIFGPGSGVSVIGGGSATLQKSWMIGDRFAEVSVGKDTTAMFQLHWNESLRTHDFKMGANAVLSVRNNSSYNLNVPCVTGVVDIDPTATFKVYVKNLGDPVFRSIDDVAAPQIESYVALSDDWKLYHVEGSYYFATDGGCFPYGSQNFCCWRSQDDGTWSNSRNWQSVVPGVSATVRGAHFNTKWDGVNMKSACVTNDVDGLSIPDVYMTSSSGPIIVRGKEITLTSGLKNTKKALSKDDPGSAVVSYGLFPFIIEAPIHATGAAFGVVAAGTGKDASVIALKGDVMVDETFAPSGDVVIDGCLTAKDLEFNPLMADAVSGGTVRGTVLTVRNGGEVILTEPSVSQTTGSVWIAKGGKMTVKGDLGWTDASMVHRVDGTLAVEGQLKGTGVETWYGKGRVELAGLASGTRAKFGRGVAIAPTASDAASWTGTVEIDGKVRIDPSVQWTVPSTLTVSRPGSVLDFAGRAGTVLEAAPTGADYDVKVSGKLVIADDITLPYVELAPGATLAFACKGDGSVPKLTAGNTVDVTGVTLKGLTDEDTAVLRKTPVLSVPDGCRIVGTPAAGKGVKYAVVDNPEGGQTLTATAERGLVLILR